MTPAEHRRLFPWYQGDAPGHGSPWHRWRVRFRCRLQLAVLEQGLDRLDRRTSGRELTPEEEQLYRDGAGLRHRIVASLTAHGG